MASIRRSLVVDVAPEHAWDAIRDVEALPTRLAQGFVAACQLEGDTRVVTFVNGLVVSERIVDSDDAARRLVWSAAGGRLSHHNASLQVVAQGAARCELVWIADLLPDAMAPAVAGLIDQGMAAMKRTLEASAAAG